MKTDRVNIGANVRAYYDEFMYDQVIDDYYGHSDFHNFGIWRGDTMAASAASRALIGELVTLSPKNPARVLEVGCGKGATTRELRAHWPHAEITGIDVSEVQLATCRQNCPSAKFMLMDACDMDFQDSSFDLIISIEAAFHFTSRQTFLEQSHRVLAPGGRLVLQDVLHHRHGEPRLEPGKADQVLLDPSVLFPPGNHLSGPAEYESLFHQVGFVRCRIIDVTAEGPRRFFQHFLSHLTNRDNCTGVDSNHVRLLRIGARLMSRQLNYCLLASADTAH